MPIVFVEHHVIAIELSSIHLIVHVAFTKRHVVGSAAHVLKRTSCPLVIKRSVIVVLSNASTVWNVSIVLILWTVAGCKAHRVAVDLLGRISNINLILLKFSIV